MDCSAPTTTPLGPVRRIITGHDSTGKSTFVSETPLSFLLFDKKVPEGGAFCEVYHTAEFPNDNAGEAKQKGNPERRGWLEENGSVARVIDMPPGDASPLMRTPAIDYILMHKGELTLYVDDNEKKIIKEGDVVTLRGSQHAWHNHTKDWCRIFMVTLPSKPLEIGGKSLGMAFAPFTVPK